MVNYSDAELDTIFSALSDATRRAILVRLTEGYQSVKELTEPFKMSAPAITKHLKVLEKAGLLRRKKVGRVHHCYLQPAPLNGITDWLAFYKQFWQSSLDSLDDFVNGTNSKGIES